MGYLTDAGYTIEDVLNWVNNERTSVLGLPPLDAIPADTNPDIAFWSCKCPIALALGSTDTFHVVVDGSFYYLDPSAEDVEDHNGVELPECVRMFIADTDHGIL